MQPSDEEDYVADAEILRQLEALRLEFEAGDKSALMRCIYLCAQFQAVFPEWAADALLALREDMATGRVVDFNEAFGKPREKSNTRAARARVAGLTSPVLSELQLLRKKRHVT